MASDLDSLEKIFCGTWKFDRDEGFEDAMRKIKFPDAEVEYISKAKPTMVISRNGDHVKIDFEIMPGVKYDITFKLGEVYISKDKAEPPSFHLKELATFKDNTLTIKAWSQMQGPSRVDYQTTMSRKGDELHALMSPIDDMSTCGNRIYKLV